jgi:membrane protease YdiL (CAAX protease family)
MFLKFNILNFGMLVPYISVIIGLYLFRNAWMAMLIYQALILLVMFFTKSFNRWKKLLKGWNTKAGIPEIFFGSAAGIALYFFEPLIGFKTDLNLNLSTFGLSGLSWVLFVIYFITLNSIFEESYWRGIFGSSEKRFLWNDLIFSGYHVLVLAFFVSWVWLILIFIAISVAARFWRELDTKYGGLILPMLSHISADASVMIIILLLTFKG